MNFEEWKATEGRKAAERINGKTRDELSTEVIRMLEMLGLITPESKVVCMEYVIIGFGYKEIYTAETAREAAEHAAEVARRERLQSYLVYDRAGNEIACCGCNGQNTER